ncbi:MAG: hypothetical protein LUM44_09960 [Pyrinomonadaceae bacterium]|nr:hypothetical protein [Pyrinomonadaceae bacterium]
MSFPPFGNGNSHGGGFIGDIPNGGVFDGNMGAPPEIGQMGATFIGNMGSPGHVPIGG